MIYDPSTLSDFLACQVQAAPVQFAVFYWFFFALGAF